MAIHLSVTQSALAVSHAVCGTAQPSMYCTIPCSECDDAASLPSAVPAAKVFPSPTPSCLSNADGVQLLSSASHPSSSA